jgi:hypothetical protein
VDLPRRPLAVHGALALGKGHRDAGRQQRQDGRLAGRRARVPNYNLRAGGLNDLNTLLQKGKGWNAAFGVHLNATESYPEANAFSEDLVDKSSKGWNWLNQSYYIKQRPDFASGNNVKRFQQRRDETDSNLQQLYIDVYYQSGWLADGLTRQLADQGWQIATEWADRHERTSLWSHVPAAAEDHRLERERHPLHRRRPRHGRERQADRVRR